MFYYFNFKSLKKKKMHNTYLPIYDLIYSGSKEPVGAKKDDNTQNTT